MGRVKRYKKVKDLTGRKDDGKCDMAPSASTLSDSYSMKVFKQMMAKQKRSKKNKKHNGKKNKKNPSQSPSVTSADEDSSNRSLAQAGAETKKVELTRLKNESLKKFNRRVREENNKIIIHSVKSQQNKTLKRKRYLDQKKRRKKQNRAERSPEPENNRLMEFPTAERLPFGATNDTVPDLSVVPRRLGAKKKREVDARVTFSKKKGGHAKQSKLSDSELQKERARVMKAYAELLKRRKLEKKSQSNDKDGRR